MKSNENVEEQMMPWQIAHYENLLLRHNRWRFFIRAGIFVSICAFAILYRMFHNRWVIYAEIVVIAFLWIVAAVNAKKEGMDYNSYIKKISPFDAKQIGMKPAPIRGAISYFFVSWDVTCFFLPFILSCFALLLSPVRPLGAQSMLEKYSDKGELSPKLIIDSHRQHRVEYITVESSKNQAAMGVFCTNCLFKAKTCTDTLMGFFGDIWNKTQEDSSVEDSSEGMRQKNNGGIEQNPTWTNS